MRGADFQPPGPDAPLAMVSPRGGGPEARAPFVIHAAVAGTEEEARLREPIDWAAQVRAVDGEDKHAVLAVVAGPLVANVDAGLASDAVPRLAEWVIKCRQSGLPDGESPEWAEMNPRVRPARSGPSR